MKTKSNIIIVMVIYCLLCQLYLQAQIQTVCFTYDTHGNRQISQICPFKMQIQNTDSTNADNGDTTGITALLTADSLTALGNNDLISEVAEGNIKVFPNPVDNMLNIQFTGTEDAANYVLYLYDNTGRLFLSKTTLQNQTLLNLQQAKAGNYYLILTAKDGRRQYWKVVKN